MNYKRRKWVILTSIVITLFLLCSCTKTVENEKMKLDFGGGTGEKEGTYSGEIENNLPNGQGKFETKNSEGEVWYYEGQWVEGQRQGEGYQYWPESGQKHEGTFDNTGLIEGSVYIEDKLVYKGETITEDGTLFYNGKGKLYNQKGDIVYDGTFERDKATDVEQIKANARNISYDKLARSPEKYDGDIIKLEGKIIQVIEGDDGSAEYRVALDEYYDEVIYVTYIREESSDRFIEDDEVTVFGRSEGLYTYESVWGSEITIPFVTGYLMIR